MSSRRPPRLLSDEEIELWIAVAKTITPQPASRLPAQPRPTDSALAPSAPVAKATPKAAKPPVRIGFSPPYRPPQSLPGVAATRSGALPPLALLERRTKRRVERGHIAIGRVLDLHGLNQADAHSSLRGFLRGAQRDDVRLVLVVTGKGQRVRRDPGGVFGDPGVLRRLVPHWLREADLRSVVLSFEEASQPHGGTGALYIQIRRRGAE